MKGVSAHLVPEKKAWRLANSKDEFIERFEKGEPIRSDFSLSVFKKVGGEVHALVRKCSTSGRVDYAFYKHWVTSIDFLIDEGVQVLDNQSFEYCKLSNSCRRNELPFECPPWIEAKKFDPSMCKDCKAFEQMDRC